MNVLSGAVKDGQAELGTLGMNLRAPPEAGDGASVRAFVRPHDVELSAEQGEGPAVATAQILRMSRVGFMIKLELTLPDGQPLSQLPDRGRPDVQKHEEAPAPRHPHPHHDRVITIATQQHTFRYSNACSCATVTSGSVRLTKWISIFAGQTAATSGLRMRQ